MSGSSAERHLDKLPEPEDISTGPSFCLQRMHQQQRPQLYIQSTHSLVIVPSDTMSRSLPALPAMSPNLDDQQLRQDPLCRLLGPLRDGLIPLYRCLKRIVWFRVSPPPCSVAQKVWLDLVSYSLKFFPLKVRLRESAQRDHIFRLCLDKLRGWWELREPAGQQGAAASGSFLGALYILPKPRHPI